MSIPYLDTGKQARKMAERQYCSWKYSVITHLVLLTVVATATFNIAWAAQGQVAAESIAEQSNAADTHAHMSEALRSSIGNVVVIPGPSPTKRDITGTYEKVTPGLYGGIGAGSQAGTLSTQVGGINVSLPIPILTVPGAIVGGIAGKTKRDIQEFRDALAEDIGHAKDQPLSNDKLALDVYRSLQNLPGLDTKLLAPAVTIPDDTEAILYVSVNDITIDVQDKDAILSTTAGLTLRRVSDEKDLYTRLILYQDRDTLTNWTANDNALWRDYANYARHYLGREIAAEVFDKVELGHELQPQQSETVALIKKNVWQGESKTTTPTLAWDLQLFGGDSYGTWINSIDESNTYYDVEIYDKHRLVYTRNQLQGPMHKLASAIDACKTYWWSVRPSYHIGGTIKYGEWMRYGVDTSSETRKGNAGNVGKQASAAPAYVQGFASLKIDCARR